MADSTRLEYELSIKLSQASAVVEDLAKRFKELASAGSDANKAVQGIGDQAKGGLQALNGIVGDIGKTLVAAFSVSKLNEFKTALIDAGEAAARFKTQLQLASSSQGEYERAVAKTNSLAQQNSQALEVVGRAYARNVQSIKDLGGNQKDAFDSTEALTLALKIQGGTTQENASVMTQFAQALGSGKLGGDELKSILENNQVLARALAEGLGVTTGRLRDLGTAGELTTEKVVRALQSQLEKLKLAAANVPDSVATSGVRLSNAFEIWASTSRIVEGLRDRVISANNAIASNFQFVADVITAAVAAIAAAIAARLVVAIGQFAVAAATGTAAAGGLAAAVGLLGGPIGAVTVIVAAAVTGLIVWMNRLNKVAENAEVVAERLKKLDEKSSVTTIKQGVDAARNTVSQGSLNVQRIQDELQFRAERGGPQNDKKIEALKKALAVEEAGLGLSQKALNDAVAKFYGPDGEPKEGGFFRSKLDTASSELDRIARSVETKKEKLDRAIQEVKNSSKAAREGVIGEINRSDATPEGKALAIEAFNKSQDRAERALIAKVRENAGGSAAKTGLGAQFSLDRAELAQLRRGLDAKLLTIRDALQAEAISYDEAYRDGLIALESYYEGRARIVRQSADAEVLRERDLIASLKSELTDLARIKPADESQKTQIKTRALQLQTEIESAGARIERIEAQTVVASRLLNNERDRARVAMSLQTLELQEQNALALGQLLSQEKIRELVTARNRKQLNEGEARKALGDSTLFDEVTKKIKIEIDRASYDQAKTQLLDLQLSNANAAGLPVSRDQVTAVVTAQNTQQLNTAKLRAQLTGDAALFEAVTKKISIEIDQGSFAAAKAKIDQITGDLALQEQKLRTLGFDGDALEARLRPFRQIAASKLDGLLPELDVLANKLDTPVEIKIKIDQAKLQLQELKKDGVIAASAIENAFASGFTDITSTLITDLKSVGDAFKRLEQAILKSVADIIAKKVGRSLTTALFGGDPSAGGVSDGDGFKAGGGGGNILATLFQNFLKGFAGGGAVVGPGGPTSDSIPAMLSNGEYVIRAQAVREYGLDFLDAVNGIRARATAPSPLLAIGGLVDVPSGAARGRGGPSTVFNYNPTYQTPDLPSFKESEGQRAARLRTMLDQGLRNR